MNTSKKTQGWRKYRAQGTGHRDDEEQGWRRLGIEEQESTRRYITERGVTRDRKSVGGDRRRKRAVLDKGEATRAPEGGEAQHSICSGSVVVRQCDDSKLGSVGELHYDPCGVVLPNWHFPTNSRPHPRAERVRASCALKTTELVGDSCRLHPLQLCVLTPGVLCTSKHTRPLISGCCCTTVPSLYMPDCNTADSSLTIVQPAAPS